MRRAFVWKRTGTGAPAADAAGVWVAGAGATGAATPAVGGVGVAAGGGGLGVAAPTRRTATAVNSATLTKRPVFRSLAIIVSSGSRSHQIFVARTGLVAILPFVRMLLPEIVDGAADGVLLGD